MLIYVNKETGASYTHMAIVEKFINPRVEAKEQNKFNFASYLEKIKKISVVEAFGLTSAEKKIIVNDWHYYCIENAFDEVEKQFFKVDTDNIDFKWG
jgi:hypothetical protein